ncbi:hypothetical protein JIR001_25960 [Polycladomyces abyssicola]|uniref:Uncharacterized protein n=1 Tax=Polycladomyces abyssicola TaxID=1125966 RepID=A0A8D5UHH8_9BACL|nr:hypothetical protein [Polycladomyces abyssicola]BCU82813.1 hypothetical protein JIR001_25960 [Polycladomyces abyssicola]
MKTLALLFLLASLIFTDAKRLWFGSVGWGLLAIFYWLDYYNKAEKVKKCKIFQSILSKIEKEKKWKLFQAILSAALSILCLWLISVS